LIAGIVIGGTVFTYLLSTFLFAFSGGQSRMVPIVGYGAIAVAGIGVVVAAAVWRWRSAVEATKWTLIAMPIGGVAVVVVEWALSFAFGAG